MGGGAFLPERVPIEAYGKGGFRFRDMSHEGSILILPSGTYGWWPLSFEVISEADFAQLAAETVKPDFLLLGCGSMMRFPGDVLRSAIGVPVDAMTTGAAVRTYNLLLAEKRNVAAALIAVEIAR
jgi:uncharacterized protein